MDQPRVLEPFQWDKIMNLRKIILALALVAVSAPALSQAVQQSGSITPNSVPRWVSNGVIGGGVSANNSPITSFGVTSNSTAGICSSSGLPTAAGRQQLCFGAPLSGPAQISLQNYGNAAPQDLQIVVNGSVISFADIASPNVAIKQAADLATTANITLSGEQTIDGSLTSNSRVLVKNQSTASQNGLYVSQIGTWTRSPDFSTSGQAVQGTIVYVTGGATNGNISYAVTSANPLTIGSSSINFGFFGTGFIQPLSGAITRPIQKKVTDSISFKDFGAKGDGVTDDSAALQAAINAAQSIQTVCFGGSTPCATSTSLVCPSGTYAHSQTLTISNSSPLRIEGPLEQSCTFAFTSNSNAPEFSVTGTQSSTNVIEFSHVGLIPATATNSSQIGINFAGAANTSLGLVYLDHVYFTGQWNALSFVNTFGPRLSSVTFNQVKCSALLATDGSANAMQVRDTNITQTGLTGACPAVVISNADAVSFDNLSANGNYNTFQFTNVSAFNLSGASYIEVPNSAGPGDMVWVGNGNKGFNLKNVNLGVVSRSFQWNNVFDLTFENVTFNGYSLTWGSNVGRVKFLSHGKLINGATVSLPSQTLSSLGTCNSTNYGDFYTVSDLASTVIGSVAAGSGSNPGAVFCNAANWIVSTTNSPIGTINTGGVSGNLVISGGGQVIGYDASINASGATLTVGLAANSAQGIVCIQGSSSGNVCRTTPAANGSQTISESGSGGTTSLIYRSSTHTYTQPANDGTYVASGDTGTVTNTMLANAATTVAGQTCTLGATCGLATPLVNTLSGDVNLSNTGQVFTGPTIAQGATGLWCATGTVTLLDTAGAAQFNVLLWDGTTTIASGAATSTGANNPVTIALSGCLNTPASNIKFSVNDATSVSGKIVFNKSGNSKDSTLTVFRLQ